MHHSRSAPSRVLAALVLCSLCRIPFVRAQYDSTVRDSTLRYSEVLATHNKVQEAPERKYNDLEVLGFVTPWNARGKEVAIAETTRGRLDVVSTVTWQVRPDGLGGGHDFDEAFYQSISTSGARNFPRLLFEAGVWSVSHFRKLAADPKPLTDSIVKLCKERSYDGVVLEVWLAILSSGAMGSAKEEMIQMIVDLGEGVRRHDLHTVLVLPPYLGPVPEHGVSEDSIRRLSLGFSNFLVMTYDYSVPGRTGPGPIAPLEWVTQVAVFFTVDCKLEGKVLLGLNLYGADFVRSANAEVTDRHVVGHEVLDMLRKYTPTIRWMDTWGEHAFSYKSSDEHAVFYPSRQSIKLRLEAARTSGCGGVAIWELGQGLDYFFEEF